MYDDLYVLPTDAGDDRVIRVGHPLAQGRADAHPGRARAGSASTRTVQPGSTLTAGSQRLAMVYAGTGSPSEYAKLNAKGKARRGDAQRRGVTPTDRAAAAAAAGASVLIVVNDGIGVLNECVGESPIPVATVHRDAGALLVALAKTRHRCPSPSLRCRTPTSSTT